MKIKKPTEINKVGDTSIIISQTDTIEDGYKDNLDLEAILKIRLILNEFYPEVRQAILGYCLFIVERDMES